MSPRLSARGERTTLRSGAGRCAGCGRPLRHTFADLGMHPRSERLITTEQLDEMEPFFPLHIYVCDACWLVQRSPSAGTGEPDEEVAAAPPSEARIAHAHQYASQIVDRFALDARSFVIQAGSHNGYLLRNFVERDIHCLGIEAAPDLAAAAVEAGVPTLARPFREALAEELAASGRQADLLIANDVLPVADDLKDLLAGIERLLRPGGVAVLEFPDLLRLVEGNQFDIIDHRHTFYFSLTAARGVVERYGLRVFNAEELPAFGGTLRVHLCREADAAHPTDPAVARLIEREHEHGLTDLETYAGFEERVRSAKRQMLGFLIEAKQRGKHVVAYGDTGSGATLLNFCGVRTDFLDYAVDRSDQGYGKYTPGTRIPVVPLSRLRETRPDYVLILPRDRQDEIMSQHDYIRDWGGRFVVPIPGLRVYS
ncbi:MAG: methyltransferase domain-containing protein [Dehalococcoidia bacterium]|nr:methyltransferase domain-containing protein [Dehalococcoidia bacterium]